MASNPIKRDSKDTTRLRPATNQTGFRLLPQLVLIVVLVAYYFVLPRVHPTHSSREGGNEASVLNTLELLSASEATPFLDRARQLKPDVLCADNLRWYAFFVKSPNSTAYRNLVLVEGREETGPYRYRLYLNRTTKMLTNMAHYACLNEHGQIAHLSRSVQDARELSYLRKVSAETERGWKRDAQRINHVEDNLYEHRLSITQWRSNLRVATVRTNTVSGCLKTVRFHTNPPSGRR